MGTLLTFPQHRARPGMPGLASNKSAEVVLLINAHTLNALMRSIGWNLTPRHLLLKGPPKYPALPAPCH